MQQCQISSTLYRGIWNHEQMVLFGWSNCCGVNYHIVVRYANFCISQKCFVECECFVVTNLVVKRLWLVNLMLLLMTRIGATVLASIIMPPHKFSQSNGAREWRFNHVESSGSLTSLQISSRILSAVGICWYLGKDDGMHVGHSGGAPYVHKIIDACRCLPCAKILRYFPCYSSDEEETSYDSSSADSTSLLTKCA